MVDYHCGSSWDKWAKAFDISLILQCEVSTRDPSYATVFSAQNTPFLTF